MLREESLKDLLAQQQLSKTDKLLLCLAVGPSTAKQVKDIRFLAVSNGLPSAKNPIRWNISSMLSKSGGRAVKTANGWELTSEGMKYVASLAGPLISSPVLTVAASLRAHLAKLSDAETLAFVEEAIKCFEAHLYRAAIVLSWVGAVSLLHKHVVANELAAFNAEATRRNPKWKAAKTTDDLGLMKEEDFLDVLQVISVLGKNVKQQLKDCLTRRNGCGHPNSLVVGENLVAAHIETLVLNVFAKF